MSSATSVRRTALVTGGGGGIGSAIAHELAANGQDVVVADLDLEKAAEVARLLDGPHSRVGAVRIDITDSDSVQQAVSRATELVGAPDILVNCAGWELAREFVDTDDDYVKRNVEINFVGMTRVTRAVLPSMIERGWGRVVSIASEAGRIGAPRSSIYAASKGAVIAFSKSIAAEVARSGVTVNVVSPGPIDTPLMAASQGEHWEKVQRFITRGIPRGRVGLPTDVAAAVAYFTSEAADYVTGQTLSVSGGLTML
jgi:2-hydroxycyclohexanecarboxyl-CoA dehydrogenase